MNAGLWTAIGQAACFVVAGIGSVWAKRSKDRTDDGNDALGRIERKLERIDERVTMHDRILDRLVGDSR